MSDRTSYSQFRPGWFQSAGVVSTDLTEAKELRVRFDDDIECVLDFTEATKGELQAALADVDFLQRVSVDSERRLLVWPNGFEIDLDMLHATATLRHRELTLGPQDPETLTACFRLSVLYFADGDTETAMSVGEPLDEAPAEFVAGLAKRLLAETERELGTDDPRVQVFRDGLPDVFRAAGVFGDGKTAHEQAQ